MQMMSVIVLAGLALSCLAAVGGLEAKEQLTPLERVAATSKGELKNPYSTSSNAIAEGHKLYMSLDCSSCHGGGGGGGWLHRSPIRSGFTATTRTPCSG